MGNRVGCGRGGAVRSLEAALILAGVSRHVTDGLAVTGLADAGGGVG